MPNVPSDPLAARVLKPHLRDNDPHPELEARLLAAIAAVESAGGVTVADLAEEVSARAAGDEELEEAVAVVAADLAAHAARTDNPHSVAASQVTFTAAGTIASVTVQAAIEEVATDAAADLAAHVAALDPHPQYLTAAEGNAAYQPLDADLTAYAALSSAGLVARTGAGTVTTRTITGTANEITATNGDGVSGNPTLSLPSALTFTGKTVTGGTYTAVTSIAISGTTASTSTTTGALTVAGGAGVAGNLFAGGNVYAPNFFLDAGVVAREITWRTSGSNRWIMRVDNTAESGSNAGSTWFLLARADDGSLIDAPLTIVRAAGGLFTTTRPTRITSTSGSGSTTTGALVVSGGVGIAGNLYLGTNFVVTGTITSSGSGSLWRNNGSIRAANADGTKYLQIGHDDTNATFVWQTGGFSIRSAALATNILVFTESGTLASGTVSIAYTKASTSTTTGALTVAGGAGIVGSASIGSTVTVRGSSHIGAITIVTASETAPQSVSQWDSTKHALLAGPGSSTTSLALAASVDQTANACDIYALTPGAAWRSLRFRADTVSVLLGGSTTATVTVSSTDLSLGDGLNIALGSTTGTKFGTASSQKLGFYGATPVTQRTLVAAATDPATTQALANSLRTALIDLGLAA